MSNADGTALSADATAEDTIFWEILRMENPSVVFPDIFVQAPVHFLVIPRKSIPQLQKATEALLEYLMLVGKWVASRPPDFA